MNYRRLLRSAPPDLYQRPCVICGSPVAFDGLRCTDVARHAQPKPFLQMYASRTGTRQNLEALAAHGWGLLACPDHEGRYPRREPPFRYALDNGAWGAFQQGVPFDANGYLRMVKALHHAADWLVIPDIVAGGLDSLAMSLDWLPRLSGVDCPLLLAVQDGMTAADVRPYLGRVGIFLGGSDHWKLSTMETWGQLAAEVGCYYHVGRVNSATRIQRCIDAGADSADGTSCTMYSANVPRLDAATLRAPSGQVGLFGGAP